jgi:hypothetical protein
MPSRTGRQIKEDSFSQKNNSPETDLDEQPDEHDYSLATSVQPLNLQDETMPRSARISSPLQERVRRGERANYPKRSQEERTETYTPKTDDHGVAAFFSPPRTKRTPPETQPQQVCHCSQLAKGELRIRGEIDTVCNHGSS